MRTPLLLLPAALAATQVYLFPAPPGANGYAPTLNAGQANAVMSHHLGGDVSAHETPEDEGMWAHLLHLWDNGDKKPRVVILEGDAQEILPESLSSPTFYLADDAESVLEPFKEAAAEALERVSNLPYVKQLLDTLDLATSKAGQALSRELSALIALADSLWSSTTSAWDAVLIRLDQAEADSALWDSASKGVHAGLQSMTQPNSPPLLVIVKDAQQHFHYARQVQMESESEVNIAKNKTTKVGKDLSSQFVLLTGTTILLLLFVVGSIALLFSVGDESLPSTLNLSVGGRKHD